MRRNDKYGTAISIALVLFGAWFFYPFLFSPEKAEALNQASNYDFNGDADGWTLTNGTSTDACAATSTNAETSMDVFAYDGSGGNPSGSFQAVTGSSTNENYRGEITQTFVAPGTGSVAVTGKFDYYATGTNWSAADSSWIRLDVYDSGNTTHIANLGCVSLNSDQAWTSLSLSGPANLTGGTTYAIRISFRSQNSGATSSNILAADNIIVDIAPEVSVSVSDGSIAFGILPLGASSTNAGDVQTITIDSGPADLDIRSTVFSDGTDAWSLGATNGDNQVKWEFSKDQSNWDVFLISDNLYSFDTNVASGTTRNLYLRLTMPSSTATYVQSSSTVTIVASAP